MRTRREAWLLAPPLAAVAAGFLLPLGALTADALHADVAGFLSGPFVRHVLGVALQQAFWSTVATLALALPLAWLHHRRAIPLGRLQMAVHAAPFVMPVFVIVFGLQIVAGPRGWLHGATGLDLLGWLGPLGAVVLAHAYYNYGFAARLVESALRRRPRSLEAAARTLGAPPAAAFARTTLPLLAPSLVAVALLVFLFCFGSFGVVLLMGDGQVWTIETALYAEITTPFGDEGEAAGLGLLLLVVNGALLATYLAVRRRSAHQRGETEPAPRRAGPFARSLAWGATALAALPLAAVLVQGFRYAPVVPSAEGAVRATETWSLVPWQALLHALPTCPMGWSTAAGCGDPIPAAFDLATALRWSATYALVSTLAALALCACLAFGARRMRILKGPVEALAGLPMAASGVLLAAAYLRLFGQGGPVGLAGTPWIVLLAHTMLVFPFVARVVLPAFDAHDTRLDEAARLAGAPPAAVAGRVLWPSLRAPVLAAASLALAMSLADFGASTLLQASGNRSLTVWIHEIDSIAFNPLHHASAVALAGLLCAITVLAYVGVERAAQRQERRRKDLAAGVVA